VLTRVGRVPPCGRVVRSGRPGRRRAGGGTAADPPGPHPEGAGRDSGRGSRWLSQWPVASCRWPVASREVRPCRDRRPAQRGQIHPSQHARRGEGRDRLGQAADHAKPDPRGEELPGRAAGLRRHAGHPPAAAPDERADGRCRARGAARGRCRGAGVRRVVASRPRRRVRHVAPPAGARPGRPRAEQGRSGLEADAPAPHRAGAALARVRGDRTGVGRHRGRRGSARASAARAGARG
jgi:hypothetical protein